MPPRPQAAQAQVPELRREPGAGLIGGVCAGIAQRLGIDPWIVRVVFLATAFAGGVGCVLYLVLWALLPAADGASIAGRLPRLPAGRAALEVGLGAGLIALGGLLTLRALGLWWSDAVVWPVVLAAGGGALLWRESGRSAHRERAVEAPDEELEDDAATVVSRTGIGVALVIGAGIAFLSATGALSAARDVVLSVVVVAAVLAVIFAPVVVRLARSLAAERRERIRSEERAEMAAHLHDSVLQTLALVQQRAADPASVASLARRQERELRAWLGGRTPAGAAESVAAALEAAAGEVERAHDAQVEVVAVGNADLDERSAALVAAAREAMVNAAKFGGGSRVDVFAEASPDTIQVFVRDRGPGFDPAAVGDDRRGIRESVVGRMDRAGGRAAIRSSAAEGTEVELTLPRVGQ
jgi:signal transduction histidine kinase/phage shock protein PspC (stress-responsive transcriptional regulator)